MVLVLYDFFRSWGTYVHLVDSSLQKKKCEEGYDPLFKSRPLVDHLSAMFRQYYQPACELSVDAVMISTSCSVSFSQYLPKKPTKFGIKVFVNSEAKMGYVLTFQIYTGKCESSSLDSNGVSYWVVMDLRKRALGLYRQLLYESSSFHWPPCQEDIRQRHYDYKYHRIEWDFVSETVITMCKPPHMQLQCASLDYMMVLKLLRSTYTKWFSYQFGFNRYDTQARH